MKRYICVPQNAHESTLALQALQTNLHNTRVIYPITDSKCVAPILLVPKKTGITLEEMQNDAYENAKIYKEKTKVFMTEWLQEKSLMLETKSFFIIHVWNF